MAFVQNYNPLDDETETTGQTGVTPKLGETSTMSANQPFGVITDFVRSQQATQPAAQMQPTGVGLPQSNPFKPVQTTPATPANQMRGSQISAQMQPVSVGMQPSKPIQQPTVQTRQWNNTAQPVQRQQYYNPFPKQNPVLQQRVPAMQRLPNPAFLPLSNYLKGIR